MQKTECVTLHLKNGGIGIGVLDSEGRLIEKSGMWLFIPEENRDTRDRLLRKDVEEIIRDGGREYEETLRRLDDSTYIRRKVM